MFGKQAAQCGDKRRLAATDGSADADPQWASFAIGRHLRVIRMIAYLFVITVLGGLLGLAAPNLNFPSFLELFLPASVTNHSYTFPVGASGTYTIELGVQNTSGPTGAAMNVFMSR